MFLHPFVYGGAASYIKPAYMFATRLEFELTILARGRLIGAALRLHENVGNVIRLPTTFF